MKPSGNKPMEACVVIKNILKKIFKNKIKEEQIDRHKAHVSTDQSSYPSIN